MALLLHQRKNKYHNDKTSLPSILACTRNLTGPSQVHSQERWRWGHIRCCIILDLLVKVAFYRRGNRSLHSFHGDLRATEAFQQWSDQICALQETEVLVKAGSQDA